MPETDVIGLAGIGEGIKDRQTLTAGFTSGEKTILPDDSHSAIESFGRIVVDIEERIFLDFQSSYSLSVQDRIFASCSIINAFKTTF